MAELAEPRGQNLVARGKRIAERSLPGAGAGRRENKYLSISALEDFLQILKQRQRELGKLGRSMIFHRYHHGARDAVGDVGRSWDEQKVAARHDESSICLPAYTINKTIGSSATAEVARKKFLY
jgi:hypothetical protein